MTRRRVQWTGGARAGVHTHTHRALSRPRSHTRMQLAQAQDQGGLQWAGRHLQAEEGHAAREGIQPQQRWGGWLGGRACGRVGGLEAGLEAGWVGGWVCLQSAPPPPTHTRTHPPNARVQSGRSLVRTPLCASRWCGRPFARWGWRRWSPTTSMCASTVRVQGGRLPLHLAACVLPRAPQRCECMGVQRGGRVLVCA